MPRRFDDDEPRPEPLVRLLSDLGGAVRRAAEGGKALPSQRPSARAKRHDEDATGVESDEATGTAWRRPAAGGRPARRPRGNEGMDVGGPAPDDEAGFSRAKPRAVPPALDPPMDDGSGAAWPARPSSPATSSPASKGRAGRWGEGPGALGRPQGSAASIGAPQTAYGGKKRKAPRAPNAERFWAAVLYAVGQRETSSGGLRQILANKVRRHALTLEGEARAEAEASGALLVEAAVERAVRERLVDDARYAEMMARGWRARGGGERRIAMELKRKGLGAEQSQDALAAVDGETIDGIDDRALLGQEADAEAAERLCRKRKIGPYRPGPMPTEPADRARLWRREAGILARAGFSGSLVSDILGRPPAEADED